MNEHEMAILVRSVKALCPAQKFDEFTPDTWMIVIGDLDFEDANGALRELGRRQPFIGPSDIVAEIARVRRSRSTWPTGMVAVGIEADIPDVDDPDRTADYITALRAGRNRRYGPDELKARPVQKALESAFQHVETGFTYVASKWNRAAIAVAPAPMLPKADVADDPDLADAQAILREVGTHRAWRIAARAELETEGAVLTHRAVAIRAADMATRPEAGQS